MKRAGTIGDDTCPSVSDLWLREGKRAVIPNVFEKVVCTTDRDSVLVYVVTENKEMAIKTFKRKLLMLTGK